MREIFSSTREALLTAAVAGDLFIVLPVIVSACKELLAVHASGAPHSQTLPDVIVPTSFNFPHSGKLLSLSFVLFAGWFSDTAIRVADYPRLGVSGIVTLFGSTTSAMPFLLDLFRVPADTFQLFLASGIVNSRFGTLVAASHTVAITLIGTCAVTGSLRWRPRAIARFLVVTCRVDRRRDRWLTRAGGKPLRRVTHTRRSARGHAPGDPRRRGRAEGHGARSR